MSKNFIIFLSLSVITIVGLFFRVYKINELPLEMHRDELDIAYNAYSILKTSNDEHNKGPYPLIFESFGDYKLPMMVYLVAFSINFFDLNVFAVRLPNVILSTLLIPITFFFVREIFAKFKHKNTLGLLSATLLSLSYWHIFLSRTIYEPIAGLTFHVLSLFLVLKARKNPIFFLPALLTFVISFYTYNLPLLLSPMLIILMVFAYKSEFLYKNKKYFTIGFLICYFLIVLSFFAGLSELTKGKSQTTIVNNIDINREISKTADKLFLAGANPQLRKVYSDDYFVILHRFARNYFSTYNPDYLFFSGGKNPWHSLSVINIGNIDPIYIVLIIATFIYLIRLRKEIVYPAFIFTCGYIFLSPIPNSLTIDAPVTNRLMDFHYSIVIFSTLGLYWIFFKLPIMSTKIKYSVIATFSLIFALSFGNFLTRYFYLHSRSLDPNWHSGIRAVMEKTAVYKDDFDLIILNSENVSDWGSVQTSFTYLTFFHKYDPIKFQENAVWFRGNDLHQVTEFDPYLIKKIDANFLKEKSEFYKSKGIKKILYITRVKDKNIIPETGFVLIETVQNFENDPIWAIYSYSVK